MLSTEISDLNNSCLEAKVEENDYTVLTVDDLEYELELAEVGLKKKIAFIDNQVSRFWRQEKIMLMMLQLVSAQHTNITPAKLEEFEATFKHFAWEETNASDVSSLWETQLMTSITDPRNVGDAFSLGEFRYRLRCRCCVQRITMGLHCSIGGRTGNDFLRARTTLWRCHIRGVAQSARQHYSRRCVLP